MGLVTVTVPTMPMGHNGVPSGVGQAGALLDK